MILDTHVHVFPPEIVPNIESYLKKDTFLQMICKSPGHRYASLEDVLYEMDRCGVDKAMVGGFASNHEELNMRMNDYVLEGAQKYPEKILPMISVSPHQNSMEEEVDRCIASGAIGVGELFPWGQEFELEGEMADRLARCCEERNLPLLLHVNEEVGHYYPGKGEVSVKEAAKFAQRYPQLKIIYAHWGGGLLFYELMPELKRDLSHVLYDVSAGPFIYLPEVYRVVREIGIMDKILLGTDYPLISPKRYFCEMEEANLTSQEKEMIKGKNAEVLLGLA